MTKKPHPEARRFGIAIVTSTTIPPGVMWIGTSPTNAIWVRFVPDEDAKEPT